MFSQLNSVSAITNFFLFFFRSRAIIFFLAEGAVDKALQLSGSDVGGWTAIVEPFPFLKYEGRYVHFF